MDKQFLLAVFAAAFSFSGAAYAADPKPGMGYFSSVSAGASSGSLEGFSMASRSFAVYGLGANLGLTWGGLMFGAGGEYNFWRQLTDPAELNNTNAQGKEFSIAAVVGYNFKSFVLLGKYYISSKYTLDKQNPAGADVAFVKPDSSFAVEVQIPIRSGKPYIGLNYKKMKYGSAEIAGTETEMPSGSEVEASAFGAAFGYSF